MLPNGEWVAVFGNGYSSATGSAALFVVNLQTGAAKKIVVDPSGGNGLGGVAAQRGTAGKSPRSMPATEGEIWKFEFDGARRVASGSRGAALFAATSSNATPQPISQAPALYDHAEGGKMVVLGTGVLVTDADAKDKGVQSMYGVWDKPSDAVARPMAREPVGGTNRVLGFTGKDSKTSLGFRCSDRWEPRPRADGGSIWTSLKAFA